MHWVAQQALKAVRTVVVTHVVNDNWPVLGIAARTPEALARRRQSSKRQNEAVQAWNPAEHPAWLTNEYYIANIQPRLAQLTRPKIAEALGVSIPYASEIRNGNCVPHIRHWLRLARLVDISYRSFFAAIDTLEST